jgi:hypothetical protein
MLVSMAYIMCDILQWHLADRASSDVASNRTHCIVIMYRVKLAVCCIEYIMSTCKLVLSL